MALIVDPQQAEYPRKSAREEKETWGSADDGDYDDESYDDDDGERLIRRDDVRGDDRHPVKKNNFTTGTRCTMKRCLVVLLCSLGAMMMILVASARMQQQGSSPPPNGGCEGDLVPLRCARRCSHLKMCTGMKSDTIITCLDDRERARCVPGCGCPSDRPYYLSPTKCSTAVCTRTTSPVTTSGNSTSFDNSNFTASPTITPTKPSEHFSHRDFQDADEESGVIWDVANTKMCMNYLPYKEVCRYASDSFNWMKMRQAQMKTSLEPYTSKREKHPLCPKTNTDNVLVHFQNWDTEHNGWMRPIIADMAAHQDKCPVPCRVSPTFQRAPPQTTMILYLTMMRSPEEVVFNRPNANVLSGHALWEYTFSFGMFDNRTILRKDLDIIISSDLLAELYVGYSFICSPLHEWDPVERLNVTKENPYHCFFPAPRTAAEVEARKFMGMVVSNCDTYMRSRTYYLEDLFKELATFGMSIDSYGRCMHTPGLTAPAFGGNAKAATLNRYKFCFCFENLMRPGYLTEKLTECLQAGSLPVYLGAPDVALFAPGGRSSFINALDFATPRELAQRLVYLDGNTTAYLEYFKWRNEPGSALARKALEKSYRMNYYGFFHSPERWLCRLCQYYLTTYCGRTPEEVHMSYYDGSRGGDGI